MVKKSQQHLNKEAQERIKSYQIRKELHERAVATKKRNNLIIMWSVVSIFVVALALGVTSAFYSSTTPESSSVPTEPVATAPDPSLSENRSWSGSMNVANVPVTFELDGALAPQAVASTLRLVNSGFYESISCHRLTTEGIYVLQCGDPSGDGTGGPGYSYGPIENAPVDDVYPAGTIAMARQGGNGSSMGSQFFLVYEDSTIPSDAAGGYTVIGRINSGLPELVSQITSQGTADGSADGAPKVPVTLTGVSVK